MSLVWQVMRNETAYRADGIGRYEHFSYPLDPLLHRFANVVLSAPPKLRVSIICTRGVSTEGTKSATPDYELRVEESQILQKICAKLWELGG
jgi:hypothetical protein